MKKIDALFIVPSARKKIFQKLENLAAIEPPAFAGLFANYLRKRACLVDILDAPAFNLGPEEIADQVAQINPLLAIVMVYGHQPSASTQSMPAAGEVARQIKTKNKNIKIIMTGTHPSALPERTLKEETIDFVCEGEGPLTFISLLKVLKNGGNLKTVPGLWYREKNIIKFNPPAPLIDDLDKEFSGIAWDLLPMDKYRAHNWHCFEDINHRSPYAAIHTSFGCPFGCTFCCINAPFGRPSYRLFSPEYVIKEIDVLVKKYKVKNIKFIDEMFFLNEDHVVGICDLIIKRGYDLNIWAYARVDTVKEELLEKVKKAGIKWLALGIESASKHVRSGAKKIFTNEDILEVTKKIRKAGIYLNANYIFGLPDDTLESMRETLALAQEINAEWANFFSAMAYPGSALYKMAKEKGLALPDDPDGPGWLGYSQYAYNSLPLSTEKLSAGQVLKFRDYAFNTYFSSPVYLKMIKKEFGEEAVSHIKEMLSTTLDRKITQGC
jgi:radical SAM superfamily enzyme YgiQ (UPF0313 family)